MQKILDCLTFGKSEKSYDEVVRTFCLTLHFYSPRAYKYVRSKFNNNLPSISSIRNWYSASNASPGFTTEAFESLKKKVDEFNKDNQAEERKMLICCIMCDEMSMRQHIQFNATTNKFDGFVDVGRPNPDQCSMKVAKDVLVFMVSGLSEDFKIPIGYFFANGLNADERAALTDEALFRLGEIGVEIASITLDGLPANLTMCKQLGADFHEEKAYFRDPKWPDRKIYVFLDPPHMIKLVRNCIGSRNLVDGDGGIIDWKYFVALYEAQKGLSWNLGNKITKTHIEYHNQKMSVKLAAELLSNSVADSMEFMKGECDKFVGVDATVKIVRIVNDIFDIMNSTTRSKVSSVLFKRPISASTCQQMFQRFGEAESYFLGLSVVGETNSIFRSSISTAFIGLYNNMINFKAIYKEYVQKNRIDALVTHRFCQDLLETFFSSIRSMGGSLFTVI